VKVGTVTVRTSDVRPGVRKLSCACRWTGRADGHEAAVALAEQHGKDSTCAARAAALVPEPREPAGAVPPPLQVALPARAAAVSTNAVPQLVFTSASSS
jgi:hypothetical protein